MLWGIKTDIKKEEEAVYDFVISSEKCCLSEVALWSGVVEITSIKLDNQIGMISQKILWCMLQMVLPFIRKTSAYLTQSINGDLRARA